MNGVKQYSVQQYCQDYCRGLADEAWQGWNRFWFTPADPATYCLIRILAGLMLFYTHLVWTIDLEAFFGPMPWLSVEALRPGYEVGPFAFSYLNYVSSPAVLWPAHVAALIVFAMLTAGLFSRTTAVLAFVVTVSYANRVPGALFGLDQINGMLAMYLMIGPCGARYSIDRWRQRRRAESITVRPSVPANVAIRLIQLHMCVIYLSAGLGKLQGTSWWDGTATWLSVANLEYQSIDMTWLAGWPWLVSLLTHVTVFWEISYAALVWPRLTRPLVLLLAIPLHLGIALFLGMITFGLVMLIANAAFLSPALVRRVLERKNMNGR